MRPNNNNNVYILGAGFSAEAGLPLVASFLARMRDAVDWLDDNGREEERQAIERVLEFRHRSSAAGYRMNLDLDNIEHLFSVAAAKSGSATAEDIRLAIAATLDFTAQTGTQLIARLRISEAEGWPCTSRWRTAATRWVVGSDGAFDDVESSLYDYYAALLSGLATGQANMEANTVITFNYDLLLEESLCRLAVPFTYNVSGPDVEFDSTAKAQDERADAFRILKLHGSLNWAETGSGSVVVHGDYQRVRAAKLRPLLVPPTWHKSFNGALLRVWDAAVAALAAATRIILIGFSIPPNDLHFKYLLATGLQDNSSLRSIKIVDPRAGKLRSQYEEVFRADQFNYGIVTCREKRTAEFLFDRDEIAAMGRPLTHPALKLVDDSQGHLMINKRWDPSGKISADWGRRYRAEHGLSPGGA
jgi:hypothetical protein